MIPRWLIFLSLVLCVIGYLAHDPNYAPSPLLRAAYQGDVETVRRMLPLSEQQQQQTTSAAASKQQQTSGETAYRAHIKAQANVRDGRNNTALHWASKSHTNTTLDILKHLIYAGIDVAALNAGGSTALHWATSAENDNDRRARSDGDNVEDDVDVVDEAASISNQVINLLISHGLDVDAPNALGETPLHWAVDWLRPSTVKHLLTHHHADPNTRDADGNTPLHKIKFDCDQNPHCTEIVKLLLKHGANASLKNNFSRLALQYFKTGEKEQQTPEKMKELEERLKEEERAKIEYEAKYGKVKPGEGVDSSATGASDPSSTTTPPSTPDQITPDQVAQIQQDFEVFKKNLTEILNQERTLTKEEVEAAAKAKREKEDREDEV